MIPYGAGGGTDIIGRAFAGPASEILGVPITVSNRAGAAGTVGAGEAARARPDGTTILMVSAASYSLATMMRELDVNALDSFRPIGQIGTLSTSLMGIRPVEARLQAFSGCQFQGMSSSMRLIL